MTFHWPGIPAKTKSNRYINNGRPRIEVDPVQLEKMLREGLSYNEIAKKLGNASFNVVRRRAVEFGLDALNMHVNTRKWVDLTPEEIENCYGGTVDDFARAILAKSKEKNT